MDELGGRQQPGKEGGHSVGDGHLQRVGVHEPHTRFVATQVVGRLSKVISNFSCLRIYCGYLGYVRTVFMGSTLRGPSRRGAGDVDEGSLTEAVLKSYGQEDGSRGQEMAAAVLPARLTLWLRLEQDMAQELAAAIRVRAEEDNQTRGGVPELRVAVADWLSPRPVCRSCGEIMGGKEPRWCSAPTRTRYRSTVPMDMMDFGIFPLWDMEETWVPGRKRRCQPSRKAYSPVCPFNSETFRKARKACTVLGEYSVVIDRDARVMLALSDPKKEIPDSVRKARKVFDKAMESAIRANGRLICKAQLKLYSSCGSVTRADLLQGGAMGCRRALLDYDDSKASFATYALPWIRQGMGESFGVRDLIDTPSDVLARRRRVDGLGLKAQEILLTLEETAAGGDGTSLAEVLAPITTTRSAFVLKLLMQLSMEGWSSERKLEKLAAWTASVVDEALDAVPAQPTSSKYPPKPQPARPRMGGMAFLSSLRYGTAVITSIPEDDRSVTPEWAGGWNPTDCRISSFVAPDQEGAWLDEQDHNAEQRLFHAALAKVRHEDPEAAEVLRRHSGMEGMDAETINEIAADGLHGTGRKLSRESIRLLGNRATARVKAHLLAQGVFGPEAEAPVTPHAPPTWTARTSTSSGMQVLWPSAVPTTTKAVVKPVVDAETWDQFRADASSISW